MPLLLVKSMTGDITDLFLLPQLTEKEFVDFIRKDHPLSPINVWVTGLFKITCQLNPRLKNFMKIPGQSH